MGKLKRRSALGAFGLSLTASMNGIGKNGAPPLPGFGWPPATVGLSGPARGYQAPRPMNLQRIQWPCGVELEKERETREVGPKKNTVAIGCQGDVRGIRLQLTWL
jgi:hypothetical protein